MREREKQENYGAVISVNKATFPFFFFILFWLYMTKCKEIKKSNNNPSIVRGIIEFTENFS